MKRLFYFRTCNQDYFRIIGRAELIQIDSIDHLIARRVDARNRSVRSDEQIFIVLIRTRADTVELAQVLDEYSFFFKLSSFKALRNKNSHH